MIRTTVRIDTRKLDAMIKRSPDVARECTKDAADWAADYIKSHWSPVAPSAPYTAPAVRTGKLNDSVVVRERRGTLGQFISALSGKSMTQFVVQVNAEYAAALELGKEKAPNTILPRPYVVPAVIALSQRLEKHMYPIIDARSKVYDKDIGEFAEVYEEIDGGSISFTSMGDS